MQRSFLARSFSAFTRGVLAASLILLVLSFIERANARPAYPLSDADIRVASFQQAIDGSRDAEQLRRLYQLTNYRNIWSGDEAAENRIEALNTALARISADGHSRHHYPIATNASDADLVNDIATTRVFLRLIGDLTHGRTSPNELGIEWDISRTGDDVAAIAASVVEAGNFRAALDRVGPAHSHYSTLRTALQYYQRIAENGGWVALPAETLLKPGAMDFRVALLRERLATESGNTYLMKTAVPGLYGKALEAAVVAFQRSHGLDQDGIVGRDTVAALNVPVERRIEQIALNLERWRWLPRELGNRHVLVNTAEFTLSLYENNRSTLDMRVVVGKTQRQTPIVSKKMKYLVLNPTWTVPPKILHDDIGMRN